MCFSHQVCIVLRRYQGKLPVYLWINNRPAYIKLVEHHAIIPIENLPGGLLPL